jgi:1-deoxy-D-xylulose-5-phosphate synthase
MSISKNIGRFAKSMAKIRKKRSYFKAKRATVSFIKKLPLVGDWLFRKIRDAKKSFKNKLYGSNYFEDMGLYYLGPADGNNYDDVEALLDAAKKAGESVLVHLKTKKGKGYEKAENFPDIYHGVRPAAKAKTETNFSAEFGKAICALAENDEKICAITAAMSSGTGLDGFAAKYPERFFDVGIAEEHAVTFAAGLSASGYKPVFAVYSSFLQRGYDQLIHDVALQRLPAVFCVDRAGFNNSDGATHHGIFDVAFASQLPNVKIYAPVTYKGLEASLREALDEKSTAIIRYPSGGERDDIVKAFYNGEKIENVGIRRDFSPSDLPKNIIITHGKIAAECLKAKKLIGDGVGIVLCEYIAPYDSLADEIEGVINEVSPKSIIFVEEEIKAGGFGMMLSEKLRERGRLDGIQYAVMGCDDPFVVRREGESYLSASKLDFEAIARKIRELNTD